MTLDVLCEKRGAAGVIVLNRPHALNALTLGMVRSIRQALDAWAEAPDIRCVVIYGAGGKAFCAGGDIRLIYEAGLRGDYDAACAFWREEFALNIRIKFYPKPYVALMDGVAMGGGAGLSIHGSHRIVSERLIFAMPETRIGYFPDVGATYFLSRAPFSIGRYLAYTGARIHAGDAIAAGLAQYCAPSASFPALISALTNGEAVESAIKRHSVAAPSGVLAAQAALIDRLFGTEDGAKLFSNLAADESHFAQEAAAALQRVSPTSLAIALRQMRFGPHLNFIEAMKLEYGVASRICRNKDMYEGVRAQIIDKTNDPQWRPATLEQAQETVDAYFESYADSDIDASFSAAAFH